MTPQTIFWSLVLAAFLLLLGRMSKSLFPVLQRYYLPSSLIAGGLALVLGPQVLGAMAPELSGRLVPPVVLQVWRALPGLLISVVFAALFLGHRVSRPREIWRKAGPQVVLGQTMAWGQYVVGISLGLLVLTPFFGMNPLAGALIEIAFEGGHGTAAGLAFLFRDLGFPEGADLALGLATVGLVSGVVLGTVLVNWAARRHIIAPTTEAPSPHIFSAEEPTEEELRELRWGREQESKPTDPMSVQLGVVGLAVGIGWGLKQLMVLGEQAFRGGEASLMPHVPLFPLAMIGGVVVQLCVNALGQSHHISRPLMNRISGTALDFTIVAALGTLSLTTLGQHLGPFLLLAATGILWNLFCLLVVAPRVIPTHWFERGIGDFGQSTGVTVTGILLMRMADPQNKSGALESFGYKQLLFEPIVGGGLFTAASMPLILHWGPVPILVLTAGITLFWLVLGWRLFGRHL